MNTHNALNEYGIKPASYRYHNEVIVVFDILTHDEDTPLAEPLVLYRDLIAPLEHRDGRPTTVYRRHTMGLAKFKKLLLVETIKEL